MNRKLKRLYNRTIDLFRLHLSYRKAKYISYKRNKIKKDKILILRVSDLKKIDRYVYTLLKFFSIQGYSIYFRRLNLHLFKREFYNKNPQSCQYWDLILKEGLIIFDSPSSVSKCIVLGEDDISIDYFSLFLFPDIYHNPLVVPMTMHPLFYYRNIWNDPVGKEPAKINSIFMAGNFDPVYDKFDENLFKMESRASVLRFLRQSFLATETKTRKAFFDFMNSNRDKECIITERSDFGFEITEMRSILKRFPFFLALPGAVMPHCHNIVEAFSVGSVPILHKEYAKFWSPQLVHLKNCIIYENFADLKNKMELVFSLQDVLVKQLRQNAYDYYCKHLTPSAVVEKIENRKDQIVFLQAEYYSVSQLQSTLLPR